MKDIFIAHTPYHLILSIGLSNNNFENTDLWIYEDFYISNNLKKTLCDLFNKVIFYNEERLLYKLVNINQGIGIYIINKLMPKIINLDTKYKNIYIFNDSVLETQYISQKIKYNKLIYIEDGSVVYLEKYILSSKKIQTIFSIGSYNYSTKYEVLYGAYGIYTKINKRLVMWPDLVVDNLKEDNIENEEINSEVLSRGINLLYNDFIKTIKKQIKDNPVILVVLEHSEFFLKNPNVSNKKYVQIVEYILTNTFSKYDIYIKYHPRENNYYLDALITKYNVNILDKNIPIEVFSQLNNVYIVSITSTVLFTFAKLMGGNHIISLIDLLSIVNIELYNKFKFLKINVPQNLYELLSIFQKNSEECNL